MSLFSPNYHFTGTYSAYGGYRVDTYDLITEQAGPGTFYFFVKNVGFPYVQAILVSEWSLSNYTNVLFNRDTYFNVSTSETSGIKYENNSYNYNYNYNNRKRYASSTATVRGAYVTDNNTTFYDISKKNYVDLHVIGTAPLVIRSQQFSIGTITGHHNAVIITDFGVKLTFLNNFLLLQYVDFRIFNATILKDSNITINKNGILSSFNPYKLSNLDENINYSTFFDILTVNFGGILRFFNETNGIDSNRIILNHGSILEINKNTEIFSKFLTINSSTIRQISTLKSYFSNSFLTDSNFTDTDHQYLNTSIVTVNLIIDKNCDVEIISTLIVKGVIIKNYGTIKLLNNSMIKENSEEIMNNNNNYDNNLISYLSIEKNGILLLTSSSALLEIPFWIKNGGFISVLKNSKLQINNGGICDNNCTVNVMKNSELIFQYNPIVFQPLGKIVGDGLINIKSILYPPLVIDSKIIVRISTLGILFYTNKNMSMVNFYSLYNNLYQIKDNIMINNNNNNDDNNRINFFMTNISISMGGKFRISENVNVNINNINLNDGLINIYNNSTLFLSNSLNFTSGEIDGNGILNIQKNGFLFLSPIDSINSIISRVNVKNYGNIYAYYNTINFIKYPIINNYGNIKFYGFQNWENNQLLSSYEDSFSINWENAPKGNIYENYDLIKCAKKCINNEIISSTIGNAEILIENYVSCKSFLYNKKTNICQINSQYVSTSTYTPNVTYTWDVYNKNDIWLKSPKIINYVNATILAYPEKHSLLLGNTININLDIQNYGIIKIASKIILFFGYEFVHFKNGILQIFGIFKTRKSSMSGLLLGNGSIHFLNTNNTLITNDTVKSDVNFEYHNLETSIISENLNVNIYSIVNVNKYCTILLFHNLLIDNGKLNILTNSLYLNVTNLSMLNNGVVQTNQIVRTKYNDNYQKCENNTILNQELIYFNNFSSCYDIVIYSINITVSTGSVIFGSFSYVHAVFLSVDFNSSITSKGRGYSYQNIDLNATSKYEFYGKIDFFAFVSYLSNININLNININISMNINKVINVL